MVIWWDSNALLGHAGPLLHAAAAAAAALCAAKFQNSLESSEDILDLGPATQQHGRNMLEFKHSPYPTAGVPR